MHESIVRRETDNLGLLPMIESRDDVEESRGAIRRRAPLIRSYRVKAPWPTYTRCALIRLTNARASIRARTHARSAIGTHASHDTLVRGARQFFFSIFPSFSLRERDAHEPSCCFEAHRKEAARKSRVNRRKNSDCSRAPTYCYNKTEVSSHPRHDINCKIVRGMTRTIIAQRNCREI